LPEDQIGVAAFTHAQADADVHLGADCAQIGFRQVPPQGAPAWVAKIQRIKSQD